MSASLLCITVDLHADVLYLKNGERLEGIIKSETNKDFELEVSSGAVIFTRDEVGRIERSTPAQNEALRQKWEKQNLVRQKQIERQRLEGLLNPKPPLEYSIPKEVTFSGDPNSIMVNVRLNREITVPLLLDTGASVIVLKHSIARKLGIDLENNPNDVKIQVADGRRLKAKLVVLKSVMVEEVEEEDIETAILSEDAGFINVGEGVLGMSFLKKFNFRVDNKERRIILEKL
jgi:clan AA aspartic protease (TIGR02281 family)